MAHHSPASLPHTSTYRRWVNQYIHRPWRAVTSSEIYLSLTNMFSSSPRRQSYEYSLPSHQHQIQQTPPIESTCLQKIGHGVKLVIFFIGLFFFLLYLATLVRTDGRSYLMETTPLLQCGPSQPTIEPGVVTPSTTTPAVTPTALSSSALSPVSFTVTRHDQCEAHLRQRPTFQFESSSLLWPTPATPQLRDGYSSLEHEYVRDMYPPVAWPGFVVITYSSGLYFDRLMNLIGSLHYFEPGQMIWVYDLGMTRAQRQQVECISFVRLMNIPLDALPLHVSNLFNYAWKIAILNDMQNHPEIEAFILMDAGCEISKPNALSHVKHELRKVGFWGVLQPNYILKKTSPITLKMMGIDLNRLDDKQFCAGGLIAFAIDSHAYRNVIPSAMKCAMIEECIAPLGVGRSNHNYDQSVLSGFLFHHGYKCTDVREWREWDMSRLTASPTSFNYQSITLRRWHQPKLYASFRYIYQNMTHHETCRQPSSDAMELTHLHHTLTIIDNWTRWKENATRIMNQVRALPSSLDHPLEAPKLPPMLLEQTDGSYLEDESPLMRCLHEHQHQRYPCREEIDEHINRMIESKKDYESSWFNILYLDQYFTPLLHAVRFDANISFLCALIPTCLILWYYGQFEKLSAFIVHVYRQVRNTTSREHVHERLQTTTSMSYKPIYIIIALLSIPLLAMFITSSIDNNGTSSTFIQSFASHSFLPRRHSLTLAEVPKNDGSVEFVCGVYEADCARKQGWKPSARVVVSLGVDVLHCPPTKTANQCAEMMAWTFDKLSDTLESIAKQSITPDHIIITILRHNHHHYEVEQHMKRTLRDLRASSTAFADLTLAIEHTEIGGPFQSMATTLEAEKDPNSLIVILDPRVAYPSHHLLRLTWSMEYHRLHKLEPVSYGVCGWSMVFRPDPVAVIPAYTRYSGRQVDVLQSECGVIHRRSYFTPEVIAKLSDRQHGMSHCWRQSDIWLVGGLLTTKASLAPIPQVVLPRPSDGDLLVPSDGTNHKYSPSSQVTVAGLNDVQTKLICIRAVEAVFGDWRGALRASIRAEYEPI